MKRILFFLLIFLYITCYCFTTDFDVDSSDDSSFNKSFGYSKDITSETEAEIPSLLNEREMLLLSLSTKDYPVTPGDIYNLTYFTADVPISYEVIVESDLTINLSIFGKIDAESITFLELKRIVEKKISQAYPDSLPSIKILFNGRFQVYIKGEVDKADYVNSWGMTRLSQILEGKLTPYSSIRDIEIISGDGTINQYDIFRALRFGEKEHDPYLEPCDVIVIHKTERLISITGEVRKPGEYQLLSGEGLKELIENYGDGFTELANISRVRLERFVTSKDTIAESFAINLSQGYDQDFKLVNLDSIIISKKTDKSPIIYIEGAIKCELNSNYQNKDDSCKITVPIKTGDTLYDIVWEKMDLLYPVSDLKNAYIIRYGVDKIIPLDLEKLLYEYDSTHDEELKPFDHIIIPFKQFFVSVTGAVTRPGIYSYIPNRSYYYYIEQAGGMNLSKTNGRTVKIVDVNGKPKTKNDLILPEDRLFIPNNSFLYNFNRYFPVIATVVATSLTILRILELFDVFD